MKVLKLRFASLSADIVSSTPFLLELSTMKIPNWKVNLTLNVYLDEESLPWWGLCKMDFRHGSGGVKSLFTEEESESVPSDKANLGFNWIIKERIGKKIWSLKKKILLLLWTRKLQWLPVSVTLQNPNVATKAVVALFGEIV